MPDEADLKVVAEFGVCRTPHPRVGEFHLYQNQLNFAHPNCEGQHLLMYRAEPPSGSARALEELLSLSAAPACV